MKPFQRCLIQRGVLALLVPVIVSGLALAQPQPPGAATSRASRVAVFALNAPAHAPVATSHASTMAANALRQGGPIHFMNIPEKQAAAQSAGVQTNAGAPPLPISIGVLAVAPFVLVTNKLENPLFIESGNGNGPSYAVQKGNADSTLTLTMTFRNAIPHAVLLDCVTRTFNTPSGSISADVSGGVDASSQSPLGSLQVQANDPYTDTHVTAVLLPSPQAPTSQVTIHGNIDWVFYGCELTPVS